jgi:hypothetical protein
MCSMSATRRSSASAELLGEDLAEWAARNARVRLEPLGARWAHSCGVVRRAREAVDAVSSEDGDVLIAAAFLHDVGYAPELATHAFHPLDGALWLRRQGHERLAGLVAHHTGARFEAAAYGFGEHLSAFHDERSAVTDALAYSDLTTSPTGERVTVSERLSEIARRYGSRSPVVLALREASGVLEAMVERTAQRLAT